MFKRLGGGRPRLEIDGSAILHSLSSGMTISDVARKYNISRRTVHRIKNGEDGFSTMDKQKERSYVRLTEHDVTALIERQTKR